MTPARIVWWALYNALLLPLLAVGVRLAALRSAKLRATLAGHRGLWARLEHALAARDPARPLLWFHVASAGEFLQAEPVLSRCLAAGTQCVLTVTSVSGQRWATRWAEARGDAPRPLAVDYLPLDTARNTLRLLRALRPSALIYTKYDLWPNLVWGAAGAGVPQYLLSATLHERSWRDRSALARSFYRTLYAPLAGIFAVTEGDAARFRRAVPQHPGVAVLGDTRFDSVLERRARIVPPPLPPYGDEGVVLVVGSSWPPDEQRILPGMLEALARYPTLRVVLVPHEVDAPHLARLEADCADWPTVRLSRLTAEAKAWRVLLVDSVGQLSALYAHAAVAYVGGAFSTGVHNVMEPAAMGTPPIFGPFHQNSPEAMHLAAAGLAFPIEDAQAFRAALFALLDDPARRAELGARARAWVEGQAGAAQRAFQRIRDGLAAEWPQAGR